MICLPKQEKNMTMGNTVERDWTTQAGLRAMCLMVRKSHRCGYVAVPREHRLYGIAYNECTPVLFRRWAPPRSPEDKFEVHGGLTFSDSGADAYPADGDDWWFGFDCAHAGDQTGGYASAGEVMRTTGYVVTECERLAKQLARYNARWGALGRLVDWVCRTTQRGDKLSK